MKTTENNTTKTNNPKALKLKVAEWIVKNFPKIGAKLANPAAHALVIMYWLLMILISLTLAEVLINLLPASIITAYGGFILLAVYGVMIWAGVQHAREVTERIFGLFPTVAKARHEKAVEKARKKCPCHACPASCHTEIAPAIGAITCGTNFKNINMGE